MQATGQLLDRVNMEKREDQHLIMTDGYSTEGCLDKSTCKSKLHFSSIHTIPIGAKENDF